MQTGSAGLFQQQPEALHFGACRGASEFSEPVIPPPFVIVLRVGPRVEFLDQSAFEQPPDGRIERSRAQPELPVGAGRDVLHDGVAVPVVIRQRYQDVERSRRQREQLVNAWIG